MGVSYIDKLFSHVICSKLFTKGWGKPEHIRRLLRFRKLLSNRRTCMSLIPASYPINILHQETKNGYRTMEGEFCSPLANYLQDIIPKEVAHARFQIILPQKWKSETFRPLCIHLAGTGDHYYTKRRTWLAEPLVKHGIASLILENPFYGVRKPKDQLKSNLHYVSDILVMGGCLILECLVLLQWCEKSGLGPLGVSGLSMGGHMASLVATNWPKPLVITPFLCGTTASPAFTEGVLSDSLNWELLQKQYFSDSRFCSEISKLCTIVDIPFENIRQKCRDAKLLTPYEVLLKLGTIVSQKECSNNVKNFYDSLSLILQKKVGIDIKQQYQEAVWFMRGILDECTHLHNFSVPVDTSLVIAICAKNDAYVPHEGYTRLYDVWPGATVRCINTGHVGTFVSHLDKCRYAIIEGFELAKEKCPLPSKLCYPLT